MEDTVKTITPENIDQVLRNTLSKLEEAEHTLCAPGCSTNEVADFRNDALRSVLDAVHMVEDLLHLTYTIKK